MAIRLSTRYVISHLLPDEGPRLALDKVADLGARALFEREAIDVFGKLPSIGWLSSNLELNVKMKLLAVQLDPSSQVWAAQHFPQILNLGPNGFSHSMHFGVRARI